MDRKKYTLQDFRLLSVFGYGNYSKVALVRKKDDQKIYAMKVIKKEEKVKGVKKSLFRFSEGITLLIDRDLRYRVKLLSSARCCLNPFLATCL